MFFSKPIHVLATCMLIGHTCTQLTSYFGREGHRYTSHSIILVSSTDRHNVAHGRGQSSDGVVGERSVDSYGTWVVTILSDCDGERVGCVFIDLVCVRP